MLMAVRGRQAARNEDFFRTSNEIELEESLSVNRRPDFICECSRPGCVARVPITLEEYEHVRARGNRFVVAPLHVDASLEVIVEQHPGYAIVEKLGIAGHEAMRRDPRPD
jgi:hypothetical protein